MDNIKYPDLMNRIHNLVITRQANSEGLILNRFSIGKLWEDEDKKDTTVYILTILKRTKSGVTTMRDNFDSLDGIYNFINENWGVIE